MGVCYVVEQNIQVLSNLYHRIYFTLKTENRLKGVRSLNEQNDTKKDLFILINEFEQESHERAPQNRARRPFELIKLKLCYLFLK